MIDGFSGAAVRAAEQPLLDEGWGDELMRRAALGLARECEQQLRGHTRRGTLAGSRVVVLVGLVLGEVDVYRKTLCSRRVQLKMQRQKAK